MQYNKLHKYLGLVSSQHINHDLHDCLVHAQHSHQVWMLVENFIVHDVTGNTKTWIEKVMSFITAKQFTETMLHFCFLCSFLTRVHRS